MNLQTTMKNLENNSSIVTVNGVSYTNRTELPHEHMLLVINQQKPKERNLDITDLAEPLQKTLLKVKSKSSLTSIDVSVLSKQAKQQALKQSYFTALKQHDYTCNKRSTQLVNNMTVAGTLDLVTPDGTAKLIRSVSSGDLNKLAEERRVMLKPLTLQELYDTNPLHFKLIFTLSAHRWLNPSLITQDYGFVIFTLTDNGMYGKIPMDSERRFKLYSAEETEQFITNRTQQLQQHLEAGTTPDCSPQESGYQPPEFCVERLSKANKWNTVRGSKGLSLKECQSHILLGNHPNDRVKKVDFINNNCLVCQYKTICKQNKENK